MVFASVETCEENEALRPNRWLKRFEGALNFLLLWLRRRHHQPRSSFYFAINVELPLLLNFWYRIKPLFCFWLWFLLSFEVKSHFKAVLMSGFVLLLCLPRFNECRVEWTFGITKNFMWMDNSIIDVSTNAHAMNSPNAVKWYYHDDAQWLY